jgi:hypothetical protein
MKHLNPQQQTMAALPQAMLCWRAFPSVVNFRRITLMRNCNNNIAITTLRWQRSIDVIFFIAVIFFRGDTPSNNIPQKQTPATTAQEGTLMFELLIRITKHYAVNFLQMPGVLWIEIQWANLRYRESCHLLRLDDYLLKDMGLLKVHGRIEAIDPARFDSTRLLSDHLDTHECRKKRTQHAN